VGLNEVSFLVIGWVYYICFCKILVCYRLLFYCIYFKLFWELIVIAHH